MTPVPRLFLTLLLATGLAGLSACGGSGSGSSSSSSAAAPSSSAAATPTPSGLSSNEAGLIGVEAQAVGLDVAQWSVKHDFAIPHDDADFQDTIDYAHSLSEGEKASYRKTAAKAFEVCVTKSGGGAVLGWGIYESTSGGYTAGSGAPTEAFCP